MDMRPAPWSWKRLRETTYKGDGVSWLHIFEVLDVEGSKVLEDLEKRGGRAREDPENRKIIRNWCLDCASSHPATFWSSSLRRSPRAGWLKNCRSQLRWSIRERTWRQRAFKCVTSMNTDRGQPKVWDCLDDLIPLAIYGPPNLVVLLLDF